MRCAVLLLCVLLAACTPTPTPTLSADPTSAPTAAVLGEPTAPPATATHDTSQFPPLTDVGSLAAQQAGQPAQADAAPLTATAIVAAATVGAGSAAVQAASSVAAECALSAFSARLDTLAAQVRSALEAAGLRPSDVTVTNAGVTSASGDCAVLQPLYTTLAVALAVEDTSSAALAQAAEQVLAALETALAPASLPGAHLPLLTLTFNTGSQPLLTLAVPYEAARAAYAAGLRGADLLAALSRDSSP